MQTLILTRADVEALGSMTLAVDAVEGAFTAFGRGEGTMPPKIYLSVAEGSGDFRAMPAALGDRAGIKWVNVHPANQARGDLPTVMGTFILNSPETGFPLAVMDATALTALRTGAAGAVASKHLVRQPPATVGFIGAGVQARTLHDAHRVVFPNFDAVIHDRDEEAAKRLAATIGGRTGSLAEAARADVVCTATPSRKPFLGADMVKPDAHINAMGADAPGKQELETNLLREAAVYVDDIHQAASSGEVNVPFKQGALTEDDLAGSLGEIVAGVLAPNHDGVTVFDSTGLAVQDLALAAAIYDAARERGVGLEVDFLGSTAG
ncbi:MAG: ornithine cyclodeaminase family protein [Myxococcota bacterium]